MHTSRQEKRNSPGDWSQVMRVAWTLLRRHWSRRPILLHLAIWLTVGVVMGILLIPEFNMASLIGFAIAGLIIGGILGVAFYPVTESHQLTFVGAITGLCLIPLMYGFVPSSSQDIFPALCLLLGAMIGGSGLLWLTPIRYLTQSWANQ